ncbi:hypothetical protein K2Q00_02470 [Patescibacteria group bacterium]|nr:hypothetical protein [Patescibacteria group bacterium]
MYKKYVKHVQAKTPHHRRQHAVQFAGVFTALAFTVWVTTLGVRFGTTGGTVATNDQGSGQQTMLAGVAASGDTSQAGIEVVGTTTTTFSNY